MTRPAAPGAIGASQPEPVLVADGLSVRAGRSGPLLLCGVDCRLLAGEVLSVVGPNGSGKTTLVRALSGRLRPHAGEVRLLGRPLFALSPLERARTLAVLPQENALPFALTVEEVVEMGRYPHLGRFGRPGPRDRRAVALAMERMGVDRLARRLFPTLSGGEKQRVLVARALAQEPEVLLLDEPTANLDVNHALELLRLVRSLAADPGLGVLVVEHVLAFARRFADRVLALKAGRRYAEGPPEEVLAPEVVADLFDVTDEAGRRALPSLL